MAKSLYICYFGVREPLVRTQVIPYLREIAKDAVEISLLTFEPHLGEWKPDEIESEAAALESQGIKWYRLAYHKATPLAKIYDILEGTIMVRRLLKEHKFDILHCRVHIPAVIGLLAAKLSGSKAKVLFDIRGFMPEEYVDAGIWKDNGIVFRTAKRIERWIMRKSDGFVVLTEKARGLLFPESKETGLDKFGRPVEVIPCCVDLEGRFSSNAPNRSAARERLGLSERYVIVHLGALGGLYLTEQIADHLAVARERRPDTYAMFLTQTDPGLIVPLLKARGFHEQDHMVGKVSASEVPKYLAAADVGVSFVKATYATASRSPTKIPEYLASGVPVIANAGVGDVDALIEVYKVGALVRNFSSEGYDEALREIADLGDTNAKCRATAEKLFDLDAVGGRRYRRLYEKLLTDAAGVRRPRRT